jgi:hypothetical protein
MHLTKEMLPAAIPETVQAWFMPAEKADLPKGIWQREPDKIQWVDRATGLPCLIVRNYVGALCGYAGVTPGHPLYRKSRHYEAVEKLHCARDLNYTAGCDHRPHPWQGVCHIPEPGTPDDVWWFGFDCMHAWDLVPGFQHLFDRIDLRVLGMKYRDVEWVARAVTQLAAQLHQVAA